MNQRQLAELNVGVEVGNKGQKGAEVNKAAQMARSLGGKALKESFTLNFESLFLDMFTELPVAKQTVKAPEERPLPAQAPPLQAPATHSSAAPRAESTVSAVSVQAERPEVRAEQVTPARSQEEPQDAAGDEAPRVVVSRGEKADAAADAKAPEAVVTHVKMVKIELHAQLQKTLTPDKVKEIGDQVREIVTDENLEPAEMYAGVLEIVAGLLSPRAVVDAPAIEAAAEIVQEPRGEDQAAFQKFLRRFAFELKQALPDAKVEQAKEAPIEVPARIQNQVDEALAKLVAKLDRKLTAEDRAQVAELVKQIQSEQAGAAEPKPEIKVESPRTVEIRREVARIQALEFKSEEGLKTAVRVEAASEAVVVDIGKLRRQANPNAVNPASGAGGVTAIEGASRSARSDGQAQTAWQNSYNQNAATRNADRPESARRADRPRPAQHPPVFDQIVQSARILVTEGKSEAVIRLRPQELGQVEMKVTVEENKVTVKFTAENPAVRAAITENIAELKKTLTELGLDVENVLVSLAGQFQNGDQQEAEQQAPQSARRRARGGVESTEEDGEEFSEVFPAAAVADGSTVRYVA